MTNRYLEGEFAPVHQEYTLTDLEFTGNSRTIWRAGTCETDPIRSAPSTPTLPLVHR